VDVQLCDQFQDLSQQALQAVQNVGESGVDSGKEATKLRDTSEVSDEGVKGVDEALISQTNTLRTDPNANIGDLR
jgi:hypothetical protein